MSFGKIIYFNTGEELHLRETNWQRDEENTRCITLAPRMLKRYDRDALGEFAPRNCTVARAINKNTASLSAEATFAQQWSARSEACSAQLTIGGTEPGWSRALAALGYATDAPGYASIRASRAALFISPLSDRTRHVISALLPVLYVYIRFRVYFVSTRMRTCPSPSLAVTRWISDIRVSASMCEEQRALSSRSVI